MKTVRLAHHLITLRATGSPLLSGGCRNRLLINRKGAKTRRKRKEEANIFHGNSLRPFFAPSRLCG
jgi:hypothetical protein